MGNVLIFLLDTLPNMQRKRGYDPLAPMRHQVAAAIREKYPSVEKFCFEEGFTKSTLSRFLSGKRTEFQIATLQRIAAALGKKLVVRLE
jgi:transcriptional regulator with XRE-family HTH domain